MSTALHLQLVHKVSNCLFRRLKTFKASQLKGTSHLSNPVVSCLRERYRWCVKANKGNPERARRQLLNMIEHYFGNHDHCRDFEDVNEAGEPVVWCGFHREGPEYKFRYLPRGKPLKRIHKRVTKKKTESGIEEETEEIDVKAGILDVLNVFLDDDKLAAATSGKNSNVNESFHNSTIHMLGGKQTFRGQAGHYVAVMHAAVMRHSLGESFSERMSEPQASPFR